MPLGHSKAPRAVVCSEVVFDGSVAEGGVRCVGPEGVFPTPRPHPSEETSTTTIVTAATLHTRTIFGPSYSIQRSAWKVYSPKFAPASGRWHHAHRRPWHGASTIRAGRVLG